MRTYRAKFSGGGSLVVTYEIDQTPHTWESKDAPESLREKDPYCAVWSIRNHLKYEAEFAGQTVEVESDDGPVDELIM